MKMKICVKENIEICWYWNMTMIFYVITNFGYLNKKLCKWWMRGSRRKRDGVLCKKKWNKNVRMKLVEGDKRGNITQFK